MDAIHLAKEKSKTDAEYYKVAKQAEANKLLLTAAIVGMPYAMRALLNSLHRDEGHALLALPLTWNMHLILGFLNFIAAIPMCFFGLSMAVQQRRAPRTGRAVGLAALCVVTFFMHQNSKK